MHVNRLIIVTQQQSPAAAAAPAQSMAVPVPAAAASKRQSDRTGVHQPRSKWAQTAVKEISALIKKAFKGTEWAKRFKKDAKKL